MKKKRNLSGIYFRIENKNIVFEDLSEKQQDEIMNTLNIEKLKSLAKLLSNTINELGKKFDLYRTN